MSGRLFLLLLAVVSEPAGAQRREERFYLPGSFNWSFLRRYPAAARLFNAFDYGHAVLYERLYAEPGAPADLLERAEFEFLTTDLLRHPPKFAIAEEAVAPRYTRLAWRAKQMFDWAHQLHRQIYDVYADERIPAAEKPALVERITDYYLSNHDLAFTPVPKTMALMDEAHYSQVFRERYPRFNGLIWAYHWLQVGLYEPLIGAESVAGRAAGIHEALEHFWAMVAAPARGFPQVMPMTPAVAPRFTARHPRAAAIFDNLHMMHDIISDILASDRVPRAGKAKAIEAALAEFRDGSKATMSAEDWRGMAEMMGGVARMGGVAWPIAPPPAP
ncbi:MAG TPA: hypothetical protein VGQ17_16620 [Gemmatimonadales bacterium]|jgi:hypothetical protein|nr:hypothetical protein [Gemmatimonadales bacterium]